MTMSTKPANEAKRWAMTALSDRVEIYGPEDVRLVVSLPVAPYAHAIIGNVQRLIDAANAAPPHPAAPADAGDAMRVVAALEFYAANKTYIESAPTGDEFDGMTAIDTDAGARARAALAAARRLLDAPPGVGERMREALEIAYNYLNTCHLLTGPASAELCDRAFRAVASALAVPALAVPAPAEPERAKAGETKHIPGTVPIYRNGRVEYVPPIEAPHVCGMSGFNPMKGDTCERCEAERFAREAPAASSAAEGGKRTIE